MATFKVITESERKAAADSFGKRIRFHRQQLLLTQRGLADRVQEGLRKGDKIKGFTFSYLSKIENDKLPSPSLPVILELAVVLGLGPDEFDELLKLAGRPPAGLSEKIAESPGARAFFRATIDKLSEQDWEKLATYAQRTFKLS